MAVDTFTASASWQAPIGITSVEVEVWGGGGRGGTRTTNGGGGGGGGGAYSKKTVTVVPGQFYDVVVGLGSTSNSVDGGDSSFNSGEVLAKGGKTVPNNTTTGGQGGLASEGAGTTKYDGGDGFTSTGQGGGGGSSAGTAANGTDATSATGATAPSGGGNGGNGRTSTQGNGVAGSAPGGGGGGAYRTSTSTRTGGNGADGKIVLTYNDPVKTAVAFNGSSQYGAIANFSGLNGLEDGFFIETWIRRKSDTGNYNNFLDAYSAADGGFWLNSENGSDSDGFNFGVAASEEATNWADGYISSSSGALQSDVWTHVGLMYDPVLNQCTVIINGRSWQDYPAGFPQIGSEAPLDFIDAVLEVAGYSGAYTHVDIGGFLRLWKRTLSTAEIYKNYQKNLVSANESNLAINITFSEGTGATCENEASPGDDLELTGSPTWITGPFTADKDYTNSEAFGRVSASTDDAEENASSTVVVTNSGGLEIDYDSGTEQKVGVRIPSVAVPQGATIVTAKLVFISGSDFTGTENVTIKGEDADNSSAFAASNANISGRTLTTASEAWAIPAIGWREVVLTPDLIDIVQEIVDRGGWVSGNAMSFVFYGTSSQVKGFWAYDADPVEDPEKFLAPSLYIEYTTGTETNSERAAKVTGKDTANSERAAKVTGKNTSNSERAAKTTGKALSNSERSAKVTGISTASSERAAKTTGSLTANSERDAKTTGIATTYSERAGKTVGKNTANSERAAKLTGKNVANSERSAKTAGVDTASSEREAKVTGKNSATSERSAKTTGKNTANSEREAKTTGKDSAFSERSAKVTGTPAENQVSDERSAKVIGKDSANSERSAKTTGKDTSYSERPAKTTGKSSAYSERAGKVLGKDTANSERSAKATGKQTANSERSAKTLGKAGASSERAVKVTGKAAASSERAAKTHGKTDISSERPATVRGQSSASSERPAKATGKQSTNSERAARTSGKNTANSERQAKTTGVNRADSTRQARTHGKASSVSERSAKVSGKNSASSERSAKIVGSNSASSERSAKVVGKGPWYVKAPIEMSEGSSTDWEDPAPIDTFEDSRPDWKDSDPKNWYRQH